MRFWDTSALVALTAHDRHLERVEPLASEDRKMAVWWAARVECVSAFRSRVRAGDLTGRGEVEAAVRLDALAQDWVEIQPLIAVRNVAEVLSIPLAETSMKGGEWKNITWKLFCKGCGKQYTNPKLTECPVCGTKLVRKPITM